MHLALSTVSSQALWVLLGDDGELIDFRSKISGDQSQMSTEIGALLDDLLLSQGITRHQIQSIGVVVGPGAFTGLRMGVSFVEGFCLAHRIAKIPIATFDLVRKAFVFPLRHLKAPEMTPQDYVHEGFESLLIKDAHTFEVVREVPAGVSHRGYLGSYPWPSSHDLQEAFRLSQSKRAEKLEIVYGLDPKIFGVRKPV
jgi:hypothetical protein